MTFIFLTISIFYMLSVIGISFSSEILAVIKTTIIGSRNKFMSGKNNYELKTL